MDRHGVRCDQAQYFFALAVGWTKKIAYETVRDYIVIICRMTGYDEEDIYEYLENSFEELVWDWGYLAVTMDKNSDNCETLQNVN